MDSNSTQHSKQASNCHAPIEKRWRDPNKKKHSYNRYNLFSILERELFLQSRGAVTPMSRSQTNPNGDYLGLNIPRLPPRYASLALPDDWYDHSNAREKNRKHRKSHGLINFIELSKMIAANWKNPDIESAIFVTIVAEQVRERQLQLQLKEQKEREEENCFTDVLTVKSANEIHRIEKTQRAGPSQSQPIRLSPKCEKKTTALPLINSVTQRAPRPTDTNNMNVTSRLLPCTQFPHREPYHPDVLRLMYAEQQAILCAEAEIMTIRRKELEIRRKELEILYSIRDIAHMKDSRQQHIQPHEIHSRAPPPKIIKIDDLKEARSIYQETMNRRHSNLEPSEIRSSMPHNSYDDVDAQAEKEADEFLSRVYGVRGEEALNKIKRAMFKM